MVFYSNNTKFNLIGVLGMAWMILVPVSDASADGRRLIATISSAPGSYCYENSDIGDLIIGTCHKSIDFNEQAQQPCDSSVDHDEDLAECYLGTDGEVNYYCYSGGETACAFCGAGSSDNITGYGPWSNTGSGNRASRAVFKLAGNESMNKYNDCGTKSSVSVEYGCAAGYYQSGGSGKNITCTPCPALGELTTTNAQGDTKKSTCCTSAETGFKDSRGSGKLKSKCCHSDN